MAEYSPDAKRLRLSLPGSAKESLQLAYPQQNVTESSLIEYFAQRGSRSSSLERETSRLQIEARENERALKAASQEINSLRASFEAI